MTKAEFIAWLEGFEAGIQESGQDVTSTYIFNNVIEKAQELDEPFPLPWAKDLNDLVGEYVKQIPGPHDWKIPGMKVA